MFKRPLIALLLLSGFAAHATAGSTNYEINTRTKDGGFGDRYGTDNFIYITIYGPYGNTGAIDIKGHHEMGQVEKYGYTKTDVGRPYKITVDVDGQLADKWTPDWIEVTYKGHKTRFDIYRELSYAPTDFTVPVKLNKKGQPVNAPEKKIQLAVSDNIGGESATRSHKVKTSFTEYTETRVAETETTQVGVVASMKYESPASKFGAMSAEISTSWNNEVTKHDERMSGSSFTQEIEWDFEVPVDSFVIVQRVFEVPIEYQVYSDGLTTFAMRTLGKSPSQLTEVKKQIPHVDSRLKKIIPIRESEIMKLLDASKYPGQDVSDQRAKYMEKRQFFLDRGYVYAGSQPTIDPNNPFQFDSKPTPTTPKPAPKTKLPTPKPSAPAAPKQPELSAEFVSTTWNSDKVRAQLTITNSGGAAASAFKVLVVGSKNKVVDGPDVRIGAQMVSGLLPGQSTTINISKPITAERIRGLKLLASIDVDRQITEASESNNIAVGKRTFGKGIGFVSPGSREEPAKKGKNDKSKKNGKGKKGGKNRKQ